MAAVARRPDVAERIRDPGAEQSTNTPDQFAAKMRAENQRRGAVVHASAPRVD